MGTPQNSLHRKASRCTLIVRRTPSPLCSEPVTHSPVAAQYHTTMSKPQALRAIASKVFGKRPPHNNVWNDIISGKMKPHEVEKLNWWYMPSLQSMKCPLYQDSKEANNQARTERLIRRGKGPPKKGEGKRASRKK